MSFRYATTLDREIEETTQRLIELTKYLNDLREEQAEQRGPPRPSDNLTDEERALIDSDKD